MLSQNTNESEFEPIDHFHKTQKSDLPQSEKADSRPTQIRVRIRVPKEYHQEPVISNLISEYGLTVNLVLFPGSAWEYIPGGSASNYQLPITNYQSLSNIFVKSGTISPFHTSK
mgnify:CR=1 FL=1